MQYPHSSKIGFFWKWITIAITWKWIMIARTVIQLAGKKSLKPTTLEKDHTKSIISSHDFRSPYVHLHGPPYNERACAPHIGKTL